MRILILTILIITLFSALSLHSVDDLRRFETVFNFSAGFANNLRLTDWQNINRDTAKLLLGQNINEEEEKNAVIYSGFNLEQRFYAGNLVYAPSISYYITTKGERDLKGSNGTYYNAVDLKTFSLASSIYYKIGSMRSSFILLGGGLGYYSGTLNIKMGYNNDLNTYSGSGWTVGWHSTIELNKVLGNFTLKGGLLSRFAEIYELQVENNNGDKIYDSGASLSGFSLYIGLGYII